MQLSLDLCVFRAPTAVASLSIGEIVARLRARRGVAALDSASGEPRRFSLVAFDPLRGIEPPRDLDGLREVVGRIGRPRGNVPGPFHGGFIGALAYDLGVHGETRCPHLPDPWSSPRIVGGLYCDFLVRDEARAETWLVLGESRGDEGAPVEARRREIERALTDVELAAPRVRPMRPLVRHTSSHEHRDRIERARAEIAAGEYYQVNLAHRFTRAIEGSPTDLYRRLRAVNPAPYMAYIAWDRESASDAESFPNGALLSASPELLFEFDGRTARTRPIKGTAPRGKTRAEDQCLARALLASEKDRAELAMIVDLERNDLGRVARPGSVRVERFPELASYASVHHLSADVVAEVRERVDAIDVLAALFPGGSVTGAPKLASMRAIAALEGEGRGFFTGSAGFIDARGQACFNILIRTLVWRPHAECTERFDGSTEQGDIGDVGEVSYHVGGGITWSSNAEDEDNESLAKGAALALALEASSPPQRPISRPSSRAKSSCASDTAREGVTR